MTSVAVTQCDNTLETKMGYKRKNKLKSKKSAQSEDLSDSVDQFELRVKNIENHLDTELYEPIPKRIKLEDINTDNEKAIEDTCEKRSIKSEPSDDLFSPNIIQDPYHLKEESKEDIKPDWVEDDTVPKGWKRRILPGIGVSKFNMPNLVSPDGRQFRSRQRALQTMVKMGADPLEIAEMSDLLVHEGWDTHPMLPEKWKFRKYGNANKNTIQFMNSEFQHFKSITAAIEDITKSFDEETAHRVTMFLDIQSTERRMESYDWKEDPSLPAGWKLRVAEGKKGKLFFLSADGKMFPSRSIGLQHMIKEKYPTEEIEVMKTKLLKHDGWEINENLPKGWLFKQSYNGKNINMLTNEGDVVESFVSAIEYMKINPIYSQLDIENIQRALSELGIERRLESYKWEENQTIPEGWKMRTAESKTGKQYFLSPEGLAFSSRFVAFRHMVKENYPQSEISNMRKCLKFENWQESPLLPLGWSFKETDGSHGVAFLSERGTFFKSFIRALKFAENCKTGEIVDEDVERMKLFQEDISIDRRILGYNWQESESLPDGWKIRAAKGKDGKESVKEYLLSPSGIQYQSRRVALTFLIKNNFPDEDIATMRAALSDEGWEDEKLLPMNWKYRRVSVKEIHFLSAEGSHFKGPKQAREYISSKFSPKKVKNFDMFEELESIRRRSANYAWTNNDDTIPEGWRSREVDGKVRTSFFLSPDGIQFPCRRAALQNLIKTEADPEEIVQMRGMLKHEGFVTSDKLPKNWLYKDVSSSSYQILSEDGSVFESFLSVFEYMKSSGSFSPLDIAKIEEFEKEKSQERISTLSNWQEDKNMPKGWKSRLGESVNGKRFFLSPDGQQFANRRSCLQYILKVGAYKMADLAKMKRYLKLEGWEENQYLPHGWMFKNTKHKSKGFLLSKEGELFDSVIAAKEFISSKSDQYEPSAIDNIYKLLEESNKLRRLSQVQEKEHKDCFEDKNLPKGWKVVIGSNELVSPDGVIFHSREAALEHLFKAKRSKKEISEMILSFKFEGWENNQHIPSGWLCKEKSFRNEQGMNTFMVFISNSGMLFQSINAALEYMESNPEYSTDEIKAFEKHFVKKNSKKKINLEMWSDDESLPSGWKWRTAEGKTSKVFYLSPDGIQFQSRKASLVHMIKNNYSEEVIIAMKKTLTLEEFEENANLPPGWLYKESSTKNNNGISVSVTIISDKGVIYESFSSVFEMMKSSSVYDEEDAQKLKVFMEEKSSIRRQKFEIWNDDETLPVGWKMRKTTGKVGKYFYLSPEGNQFGSRRAALVHMIKENHEKEDINFMRCSMALEGFEENDNLPKEWLFKENVSKNSGGISVGVVFITNDGEVYESFSTVLEMMGESPSYDEEDIMKLKILMNEKSTQRRQVMEEWFEDESLPQGWKFRRGDGKTGKIFFLSPDGDQFPSRRAALIHMLKNEFDTEQVNTMRKTLTLEGFEENKYLPDGWLFKENSSKNSNGVSVSVVFITNMGEVFESFSTVLDMMKSSESFNEVDINKVRKLMLVKASERRKTMEAWEEDKNLPDGWRFRIADGVQGKIFFLSPDGTQLLSRKLAFQYLARNKDVGVLKMKKLLIQFEKWEENENLPNGWLFKEIRNTNLEKGKSRILYNYQFLTAEGEFVEGTNKVIDHINQSPLYIESDFTKFSKFMPERQAQRRKKIENWSEDNTVPEGWKTRIGDGKKAKKFFINGEGKQFQTRRTALQFMIVNEYPNKEIEVMRIGFKSDGWSDDPNLPPKWMFKSTAVESKRHLKFLTDNASILESFKAARGYIKEVLPEWEDSFSSFEQNCLYELES